MNKPYFTCSFPYNSRDQDNIIKAYNQGIDSRLEGFTQSSHTWGDDGRLYLDIANVHEFQVLVRRLLELATESAEMLADTMILVQYGYETV